MGVQVTYLGHSGFLFSEGEHTLAVDPFLTGNPVARHKADEIRCTHVAITHGHEDHVGDAVGIARRNDALCISNWEICNFLGEQGVKRTDPGNPGGRIKTDFGWIAFTHAFHSSSYGGRYMGMPCGLVIQIGGVTIYHAGDTGLFGDMKLIGELYQPTIACLPVGDRFTMGPELASKAAELVRPKFAIPMHYKTYDILRQDCKEFRPTDVEVVELEPGQTWSHG